MHIYGLKQPVYPRHLLMRRSTDNVRICVKEAVVEKMLLEDEPISKIAKYTELTEEKIMELKKNLKVQKS